MEKPCLIFEHVPKTAGITLQTLLKGYYARERTFVVDGSNPAPSIEKFKAMPLTKRQSFDLVMGHGAYQLREAVGRKQVCVTMLRDPVDRLISHYYYVQRTPHHYLFDEVTKRKMSLHDYVVSGISNELENNYTLRFSRLEKDEMVAAPQEALRLAQHNLSTHFSLVGLVERFDESILLMQQKLAWKKPPFYVRENVTRNRPAKPMVDAQTLEAIRERNLLDIELYAHVKQQFAVEVNQAKPSLGKALTLFRLGQKIYSTTYPATRLLKQAAVKGIRAVRA